MKIKLLGVELTTGMGISLAELFKAMALNNGKPLSVSGYERLTYIDTVGEYHVGLVITTKDYNKFLEFKRENQGAKLVPKDISDGAKLADFNFFAIHQKTGKGVYQFYHQSCSNSTFGAICKHHYEILKNNRIQSAIEKAKQGVKELTKKAEKQIKQDYSGNFELKVLVRPQTFKTMIGELKEIQAITLAVSTLAYEETTFTSISRVAKNMTQRFTFNKNTSLSEIVSSIFSVTDSDGVESAKVEGTSKDGLERIVKMFDTPDTFGEYEFDEIAEQMNISPENFSSSEFLKTIIKVAKNQPVISGVPRK